MSKQDRQGVRTPADLERKYNLGGMENETKQHDEKLSQLNQALSQYMAETNTKISELEEKFSTSYPVGSVYVSVNNTEPSTLFGGTWELMSQGYLLTGLDQESEDAPVELQFLDKCYIWKRTA